MEIPEVYTVAEVATRLKRGRKYVYELIKRGDLPERSLGGRKVVTKDDLLCYVNKQLYGDEERTEAARAPSVEEVMKDNVSHLRKARLSRKLTQR